MGLHLYHITMGSPGYFTGESVPEAFTQNDIELIKTLVMDKTGDKLDDNYLDDDDTSMNFHFESLHPSENEILISQNLGNVLYEAGWNVVVSVIEEDPIDASWYC